MSNNNIDFSKGISNASDSKKWIDFLLTNTDKKLFIEKKNQILIKMKDICDENPIFLNFSEIKTKDEKKFSLELFTLFYIYKACSNGMGLKGTEQDKGAEKYLTVLTKIFKSDYMKYYIQYNKDLNKLGGFTEELIKLNKKDDYNKKSDDIMEEGKKLTSSLRGLYKDYITKYMDIDQFYTVTYMSWKNKYVTTYKSIVEKTLEKKEGKDEEEDDDKDKKQEKIDKITEALKSLQEAQEQYRKHLKKTDDEMKKLMEQLKKISPKDAKKHTPKDKPKDKDVKMGPTQPDTEPEVPILAEEEDLKAQDPSDTAEILDKILVCLGAK